MRKLSTDLIKSGSFTGSFSGSFYGLSPSSSYALTASYSINSTTATNLSGGTVNAISITGSLLGTSSLANNAISSSFSSVSISSSYALTASNLSPIAQDLIPITGSTYSLGSPTSKWKDLYVSTGSIYIGETVLSTSGSTLFANSSPVVTLNTASGQIEVAGLTASLSSSFASNAVLLNNTSSTVFATTGSNNFSGSQIVQGNITVIGSLIAQQYVVSSSVSYFTSSNFDGSTKFGDTDSDTHQFTGSLRSPNITGSLLGTASIALIALVALTSSYINVATNAVSSSFASTASVSVSSSYSSYAITSSYVLNSVSSSFTSTSSYSLNSVSSSYSNVANTATSATSANTATSSSFATTAGTATSATSANSATSASYALTASFALNSSGGGGGSGTVSGSVNYISKFTSGSAIGNSVIYETGSNIGIGTINPNAKLNINSSGSLVSGSVVFSVEGTQGSLFSVDDSLSGSLMSVNDISGLPILEVFSDDRLVVGTYNSNALVVTGSRVGIGTNNPIAKLQVSGNISGSSFTSSVSNGVGFLGTSSFAVTASYALNALTASFALNASGGGGGSGTVTGSLNYISKFTSTTTVGNSVMYETGSNIGIGTINPNAKLNINSSGSLVSGSVVFSVEGTQGSLFSVDDSLSGSLMSVNDISGLPILEVFSDDRLVVGTYNSNALVVTGSRVGIGTNNPIAKLQVNGNISASSFTGSVFGTSSWSTNALTASYAAGGGTTLTTGSTYPITSSWSTNAISSSFATFAVSATSATSATSANTATSASYATVAGSATSATSATSANSANTATSASYSLSSSYSVNSNTSVSSSFASTASYNLNSVSSSFSTTSSYNLNSVSSSYALTASFSLNGGGGGTTLTTGSTYPITSSWATNSITASYAMNGGGGGSVQTGNIANQTILYNVTTSQDNVISGLNLSSNKWGVTVVEEWNSGSIVGDEYYNSCSLLLHFSGSNGSTTFIDNSPSPKTVTSVNGASISTAQSKFGGTSGLFDGSDDYVTVPDNSAFDFGAGDFTIEYWEYRTESTTYRPVISRNSAGQPPWMLGWTESGNINFFAGNGSSWSIASAVSMGVIIINSWTHYAVTRQGNTFRTFQNGIQISTFTSAATIPDGAGSLQIGKYSTAVYPGYIDELRITKGVARYTGSFVTQSAAFPDNLNVSQLQTKYIGLVGGLNDSTVDYGVEKLSDSSLKIRKMTASGQPLSGSGTLSASVDRVYVNVLDYTNVMVTSSYALTASYVLGGIQTGSISNQTILYNVTTSQDNTITGLDLSGNKWDVSVIEEWNSGSGDIYYPSCSLLLHFSGSNGSTTFIDNSVTPKTVTANNGAAISTSQSKFGGASGLFDGTNDYLSTNSTSAFTFGTSDFTIELWIYQTVSSVSAYKVLVGDNVYGSVGGWQLYSYNNQLNLWKTGTEIISPSGTLTLNSWNHIVWSRSSGNNRIFINGTQVGSTVSDSTNYISTAIYVGAAKDGYGYYAGYIDELRITKNVARYTASFATQSVQFPDSLPQYETKYVGLVGGLNDTNVDYGVEKLSDTSLKIRKMSVSGTPVSGSPFLSSSVDRVYVNVLNYKEVQTTAQSASYAVSASYLINAASGESFHPFLLG